MDRKDLISKADELRRDVTSLKSRLNEVGAKKENQFNTKEELKKQVFELINKIDTLRIKKQIEELELKIETEALNLDREKKVMDRIKQLKKVYSECGVVSALDNGVENLSVELKGIRDKAKKSHNEIQEIAKENRKVYDNLMVFSKEIDKINREQEQAFDNFLKFKKEFSEVNDDLKKKLDSISLLRGQFGDNRKEEERNKEFI